MIRLIIILIVASIVGICYFIFAKMMVKKNTNFMTDTLKQTEALARRFGIDQQVRPPEDAETEKTPITIVVKYLWFLIFTGVIYFLNINFVSVAVLALWGMNACAEFMSLTVTKKMIVSYHVIFLILLYVVYAVRP